MAKRRLAVIERVSDLRRTVAGWRRAGKTVGLVPTMGALHAGHEALVAEAKARTDCVVTSIFVNPQQFSPTEDFSRYPRTFESDCAKLQALGCDVVWAPGVGDMYPEGFATKVVPAGAALGLETDFRPHFFAGVATVCCKLFTQVAPDIAVFGEKDFQQLAVVRQMVRDLDLPLEIVGYRTVREADGLAMSSRNAYLTPAERAVAPAMFRIISEVAEKVARGGQPGRLASAANRALVKAGFDTVDYVAVRHADTLAPVTAGDRDRPRRVLAAAWLGRTRLIDNVAVAG